MTSALKNHGENSRTDRADFRHDLPEDESRPKLHLSAVILFTIDSRTFRLTLHNYVL